MLENKFFEKKFSPNLVLPDAIQIYNYNKYSSTKFTSDFLFYTIDKDIIQKALDNTKKL